MKILQAALSYEKGGRTRRIVDVSTHLAAQGHEVEFYSLYAPPAWIIEKYPVLATAHVPKIRRSSLLLAAKDLYDHVRVNPPDILHGHCATTRLMVAMVSRLTGIPSVGTFHHSGLYPYNSNVGNVLTRRWIGKIVAISRNRETMLRKRLRVPEHKLALIHGGTLLPPPVMAEQRQQCRQRLGIPADRFALLSVGHLGRIKGHDFVINALPTVLAQHPNVHLYIAGQGNPPDRPRLESLIATLGLQQHVTLLGEVLDPQPLYDACDLFVLASVEEGFGLVFIEAGASHLPVLATDTGGIRDIIVHGETGLLVPPASAEALTAALLQLIDDPALRQRLAQAGYQRVKDHFTVGRMADAYLALYQELLNERRSR